MKIKRPFQEGDGQPLCVALALSLRCAVGVNHHKRAITRTKNQEVDCVFCFEDEHSQTTRKPSKLLKRHKNAAVIEE